uniref:Uncharacterized protein n=1 Tax=Papio anubis TaxID=9555 RepID=A0A8I5NE45_PAPAN
MDNKDQAELVLDGDEELIGNWSKGHSCYALTKRLAAFYPYCRDPWNFELETDDLRYLAGEISKQQSIQEENWLFLKMYSHMHSERDGLKLELMLKREAKNKSLENLQSDHVVEKKNPFSREDFKHKLATEFYICNEEPNSNNQDNGENISMAFQRSSWQPLQLQAQKPRGENCFVSRPRAQLLCAPLGNGALHPSHSSSSQVYKGPSSSLGHGFRRCKPQALAASTWCWACRCIEDKSSGLGTST